MHSKTCALLTAAIYLLVHPPPFVCAPDNLIRESCALEAIVTVMSAQHSSLEVAHEVAREAAIVLMLIANLMGGPRLIVEAGGVKALVSAISEHQAVDPPRVTYKDALGRAVEKDPTCLPELLDIACRTFTNLASPSVNCKAFTSAFSFSSFAEDTQPPGQRFLNVAHTHRHDIHSTRAYMHMHMT